MVRKHLVKRTSLLLTATALALAVVLSGAASADVGSQFQFAGLKAPDGDNVESFRFSILYADSNKMSGFDFGAVAYARSAEFSGFGPLFAIGHVTGNSDGCMCSFANIVEGTASGVNVGFLNVLGDAPDAFNIGFVTFSGESTNIDVAGMAVTKKSNTQIGLLNITEEIGSLQIGFLNIAQNGFLPVFPIFNYPKKD